MVREEERSFLSRADEESTGRGRRRNSERGGKEAPPRGKKKKGGESVRVFIEEKEVGRLCKRGKKSVLVLSNRQ